MLPRPLVEGSVCVHGGSAEDTSYMTVKQLADALAKVPDDALVAMGASLSPAILRVYPMHHRRHESNDQHCATCDRRYVYAVDTNVTLLSESASSRGDNSQPAFFNALQLGPQPILAETLIEELERYLRDAPDAIVLTPSGLASLGGTQNSAPCMIVPVLTRRQFNDFLDCELNPFAIGPLDNAVVDDIVEKAKAQVAERQRPLGDIATDLGRAFVSGGLAAIDLFYVPAAKTRATADLDCYAGRGCLLTLAEFRRAHGRAITNAHIAAFYRPVAPGDLSEPVSPLARVLSSGCTNLADIYALLDDHEFLFQ